VPFVAATFARADGGTDADVRAAREVSEALDVPWTPYRVTQRAASERRLLDEMQGTNSLAMGFILDFLDGVAAEYADPVLMTGDGGDKAFPSLAPPRSFDSLDDLAAYVFDANAVFAPADAAAVARVDEDRLRETVRRRLASYPESSLRHRYAHFYVRERGVNWLNLGEDRNRRACWSASPFYAYPFFVDAMNCPDGQKARSRLYRRFVAELAPELLDVTYADFGAPVASTEYAAKRAAYDALARYPRLKGRVLGLVTGRSGGDSDVARQLRARLATSDAAAETFDVGAITRVLDEGAVDDGGAYDLLTLASLVDDLRAGAETKA
jgi:asparagine synthase (glutamine-hydrolysing)